MSMFGNVELPTETLEHILDHLHDDTLALRASALVQRSWIPTTRIHLFDEEVICQGRSPRRDHMDNATAFLEICRSPLCTVLNAIRSAVVMVDDPTLNEAVVDALTKARNLKKLVYIHTHRGNQSSASWLAGRLPMVEDLVYDALWSFDEQTAGVISSFTNVRSLAIYTTDSCRPAFPIPSHPSQDAFINLRRLRIVISRPEATLRWLGGDFPSIRLEELELRIFSPHHRGWGSVEHLNKFLASQANNLKHLSLSVEYRGTIQYADEAQVVSLAPLILLSTLKFRIHDLRAVRHSLETLAHCSVKDLHVDYMYRSPAANDCGCNRMQEILDLAKLTETDVLSQAHLQLGHWPETHRTLAHDFIPTVFERRATQKKVSYFASNIHGIFQPDSFEALAFRVVKRAASFRSARREHES